MPKPKEIKHTDPLESPDAAREILSSAVRLYYDNGGTIRLETGVGLIHKWYHYDRAEAPQLFEAWNLLDKSYRTEWIIVDFTKDWGQECQKKTRPF